MTGTWELSRAAHTAFYSLVLPILSCACDVWTVDDGIGQSTEQLYREFLKHLLGIRDSTANAVVLAELGRYSLRFQCWQQIPRYHNRSNTLPDDARLITGAFVEDLPVIDPSYHV